MTAQSDFAALARADERGALVTLVRGPHAGAKLLLRADGSRDGTLGAPELDDAAIAHAQELMWADRSELRDDLFIDVTAPPPRLIIVGAVDLAAHLCSLARIVGWRPYVVDPRARFARPERFPDAVEVIAGWPQHAFERLGGLDAATSVVVLTHDPKVDDAALTLALPSAARFVGAMGSRRAQAARRERLIAAGIDEELIARLSAPVGLDLGALHAGETALSVMAEVVAVAHGHGGGRLVEASGGRIHAVGA